MATAATPAGAAKLEPWADQSLPVQAGLSLWLDAGRQPDAWKQHGKPPLSSESALDVWYDASGHARHFTQSARSAQPHYVAGERAAAVRFDGEDDWLLQAAGRREFDRFTLFLAVAPRSNVGGFRALLSAAETGKNDYVTGLNLDLGPFGSAMFDMLNVEGRGFGGFRNLSSAPAPLGQLQVIAVIGDSEAIRAYLNAKEAGARPRAAAALRADQIYLGARYYSNEAAPPSVSGFLDGDIAEVLLFDRLLAPTELESISAYLTRKHGPYAEELSQRDDDGGGELLRPLADPPELQVFVPGFSVRRLPVDLTNINNVRYRDDGKLVALAYDGNVYVLSDTDGDQIEDRADLFWDNQGRLVSPIGMALTPPGYKAGRGLFVASKGKVSLILDADGDGRAETEKIIATGWDPLPHQVDALGVAVAEDGSVYFGLGTTNFANAYLVEAGGKARYDPKGERGAILRIAPDFSGRQIVCSGIRFPVGLAFNRHGDLFATDQEGATWLPNGNPLDELLHILPGRHYGFPPRHPKHLPNVIDEPSVFDYAPQHQSTCGLAFNEPVNGGAVFGPGAWRGDALVCGESRGKLYRTQLARTNVGYVARNQILASLTTLTIDACVSPHGDLVIATHSGNPDWGSGPKGKGHLYKLRHADKEVPQPVACWPSGPHEVRIAFDRALDPSLLKDLVRDASIEFGPSVGAGDRFEKIRPGYEVVRRQLLQRRGKLAITGVQVTSDRRTLVLRTTTHGPAVSYAVTLPGLSGTSDQAAAHVPQLNSVELSYDLSGVEAQWMPQDTADAARWSGWLPHVDLSVAAAFTAGSAAHDTLWHSLSRPGRLTLSTSLDLWQMLRPAVQQGSSIDYTLPAEQVTLTFEADVPLAVQREGSPSHASVESNGRRRVSLAVAPIEGEPARLVITLPTGGREPGLTVWFHTAEDPTPRALPLRRFLLPWARIRHDDKTSETRMPEIAELKGGDWLRGREVFFSEQAGCARCHRVGGVGSDLGPDLSNLIHRDYDSVLRDIREPSGALNPDYIASTVRLKDGRVLHGILRSAGADSFVVRGDADGEAKPFPRDQIRKITPAALSTMPEGLDKAISPDSMRDLMTFLLTQPLDPAPLLRPGAPPARSRSELEAILAAAADSQRKSDPAPLRILLSAGPKDHGPGEHDYPQWQQRWAKLLGLADGVRVSTCQGFPSAEQFDAADVVVFYSNNPGWSKAKAADLDTFLQRGGGLVYIHYAVDGHDAPAELAQRIGLAWRAGSRFRHGAATLSFAKNPHPITAGFDQLSLIDESYWNLLGDPQRLRSLATAVEDGEDRPLLWARQQGKGRVFVSIPGHYAWTFDDPVFRVLILRSIAWTAGRPAERLTPLAAIGARIAG